MTMNIAILNWCYTYVAKATVVLIVRCTFSRIFILWRFGLGTVVKPTQNKVPEEQPYKN